MGTKRSFVEFIHDEGYGDDLAFHISVAVRNKDMRVISVQSGDLLDAATEAMDALSPASDDDCRRAARSRIRKAIGADG